jgi:uncharacterized delta-60 repeat protein
MFSHFFAKTGGIGLAMGLLISPSTRAFETNGDLDAGFNAGKLTNGQVLGAVVQPDKMLVIAGGFGKVNNVARRNIARLDTAGVLDPAFSGLLSMDGTIFQLVLQSDGKFLIVGGGASAGGGNTFSNVNGSDRFNLARLNADGSLDNTFDPARLISADGVISGGVAVNPGFVQSIVLQADGKIVVLGQFSAVATGATTSVSRSCVARFNSDGTFDATYNPGAGMASATGAPFAQYGTRQSSGKIVITGGFDHFDGVPVAGFVRLSTTGAYDSTFNAGTAADISVVAGVFAQSDDKIVVFGLFTSFNGSPCNEMTRLLVDGGVDFGFNTGKFQSYDSVGLIETVAQQPDGKLLVGGTFYSIDGVSVGAATRLKSDGTRDNTFDTSGTKSAGEVLCFAKRTSDDEYYIGGYFSAYDGNVRNNITLVKTDGTVDNAFLPSTGATDFSPEVYAILAQPDGKIIVGGLFSSVNGQPYYNLVRLLPTGAIDSSFGTTFGASRSVRALATQSTGKIIAVGSFTAIDGISRGHIARLNTDGTVDLTFNPGAGTDNIIYAVAVDASDNIYVGGSFSTYDGTTRNNLAKIKPDGGLDTTFDPLAGTGGVTPDVRAIAPPTATAGPLIGGFFTTYAGATVNRIVRVDSTTAARDTAFTTATGTAFNSTVRALSLVTGGKYYVAGSFSAFNGTSHPRLARLNSDGSLDSAFTASPTAAGTARALLQQNGKVVVAGNILSPGNPLVRYQSTGPQDTSLSTGSGLAGDDLADVAVVGPGIDALALQPDGKMLAGGIFSSYNGISHYGIVRLTNNHLQITGIFPFSGHIRITGLGDPNTIYNLQGSSDLNPIDFANIGTPTSDGTGHWTFDDLNSPSYLVHFYRAAFQ